MSKLVYIRDLTDGEIKHGYLEVVISEILDKLDADTAELSIELSSGVIECVGVIGRHIKGVVNRPGIAAFSRPGARYWEGEYESGIGLYACKTWDESAVSGMPERAGG